MGLIAKVGAQLGTLDLDVDVEAHGGETVAILGPNGAGKTTLLRTIAGLLPIGRGAVELDGVVLDDGDRRWVPPERRPIGVVFQDYLLFPHLSALDNVAFGLRSRGTPRAQANATAAELLEKMGLADFARAKPAELSGGQAQRVALARALAIEPRLLLLDEPLAALDVGARSTVRRDLSLHLNAFDGVRLLVTHDPLDAAALADRIVILEHGKVVQVGTLLEISMRPRSDYAAELVDVNLLRGIAHDDRVRLASGADLIVPHAGSGPALVVIHPRSIALHPSRPSGSPRNVIPAHVDSIDRFGDRVRVRLVGDVPLVAEITPDAVDQLALTGGSAVWAAIKATEISVFPA